MESFDQSLKYLLQHQPADFIRFALGDPTVEVQGPLPSDLPSRGRDVDGSYRITAHGRAVVAHIEFHRRHQALEDLAIDIAEAQIRLFRRERTLVVSQVWDLYGRADEPVIEARTLCWSFPPQGPLGSQSVYHRVNLRGLGWQELLARAPPALWPLVALTRHGASEPAVREACTAIEARPDLISTDRADHLAVLWFVAEAENVPVKLMKAYISEERLMESTLYQTIFEKGEARGEARGEAKNCAETIIRLLTRWMGMVDPAIRERIRTLSDRETLMRWQEEALFLNNAEEARRLAEKIQQAPLP